MSVASVALSPALEETLNLNCSFLRHCGPRMSDSIMIFLSVGDSLTPMNLMESDSIVSVKLRIQASKGFFVKKQKLVFEGRELARNDSHVRDYGVADGMVLHLVLKFSDLLAITVRTLSGKEFSFHVERGRNVGYVKRQIAKNGKGFDLADQELIYNGEELEDQRLITDFCKSNDSVIHLLVQKSAKVRGKPIEKDFELSIEALDLNGMGASYSGEYQQGALSVGCGSIEKKPLLEDLLEPLIVNSKIELPLGMKDLIRSTLNGLKKGHNPIRSSEGSGGVYFMQDSSGQKCISVFKPIDEEPMAVNNPHGLPLSVDGEGMKIGTRVGEGAIREVVAYILDHPKSDPHSFSKEMGFASVPPTVMVKCLHQGFNHPGGFECSPKNIKLGSLQMFIENIGSCEDMGPSAFPVHEVHKISVLDIRLANADRHAGNILVSKDKNGQLVLTPIDHGYCLPEKFEDCMFDWLYWPQAQQPYSSDTIDYIKALDAEQDIALLRYHGWDVPPAVTRTLRVSTMLLKKGAERGLTPFAIGSILCRETVKKESVIEQIMLEAETAVLPGASDTEFLSTVSSVMDLHLDELSL